MIDPTQTHRQRKMLRLLGIPKPIPETEAGCPCCFAGRVSVRSRGAGGWRRAARRAPGGWAAVGLDGSQHVSVGLPLPGKQWKDRRRDVSVLI